MSVMWDLPDFDDHEAVHFFHDADSGLSAIIALHSTHLGPGAGGTRFWHYEHRETAVTDALRLSRGMSFKNAMAGLPLGGGKAVILADRNRTKSPEMLTAFGRMIESLGGQYVTAEDVGITAADMVALTKETKYVSGLPVSNSGEAGGDPGPFTAMGVYLGVKAAVAHKLGRESMDGVHVAIQGVGSVGGGLAGLLAKDGAKLSIADINKDHAAALAGEIGATVVGLDEVMRIEADVFSPNALGAILDKVSIAHLNVPIVAGGANNQLATPEDGQRIFDRNILFAPDYVINSGGIISVGLEYLGEGDVQEVNRRVAMIPQRLTEIWEQSAAQKLPDSDVADNMAMALIGRG
ncbi:Leu/Phe/Val dehydrogenase [Sphingorhabdus sp. 109]|jgi:leucine dehydrogenase|uniref:Leu/Phe/Val dehydrogenase n=1 Tax=Sphingorhabdus sp. 109 TaxID=2653173 RepID=UPI0012F17B8A|nr:Glu/Leu/Phe/Val dehydrogenase dimerization domain-containing protein [Sphingorhabdus sp. 109]VWX56549.1 Leucine dehydrogenase [Sphingorhabdus sp. 109]